MADSDTLAHRVSSFVADNKRTLVVGAAAAVAVGGVGYYLYSQRGGPSSSPKDDIERNDAPVGLSDAPAKKKPKGKKRKTVKDKDGPILEERKPTSTGASVADDSEGVPASVKDLGAHLIPVLHDWSVLTIV